jgi:ABC-2 type transport system ATP-binding protein
VSPVAAELQGVSKSFGRTRALDGVDLSVACGEIQALLGPNGAGKTTALSTLVGLRRPDSGRALLFGRDPRRSEARLRLGCTPQETSLPQTLTVRETIDLVRAHYPQPRPAPELLEAFGLARRADELAENLSHGEQRYLEICLALATAPRLLLLDEPTAGMTPGETREATKLIRSIAVTRGLTLLLIEHDMSVVMGISDRVAVLHFGEKIAEGTPEEIRHDARVIEAYLGGVDD